MATGLLGFNPYGGGTVLDISSKPTQYAIQEIQHQQAKAEAIDKYYKDYEKSLNAQGLTPEEQRIFADKLNEVKGFGIKNRDQINNPTKYGYDAQSTLDAGFRNLKDYLAGAKQAAGERKALKDFHDKQIAEGKHVTDNYLDIFNDAMKPYGNGYVQPNLNNVQFYKPYNQTEYVNELRKIPSVEGTQKEDLIKLPVTGINDKPRFAITKYPDINQLQSISATTLQNNIGHQMLAQQLLNDKNEIQRLGKIYSDRMPLLPNGQKQIMPLTPEGIHLAHTISEAPLTQSNPFTPEESEASKTRRSINTATTIHKINKDYDLNNNDIPTTPHIFDLFGGGGQPIYLGQAADGHTYKIINGFVTNENNEPASINNYNTEGKNLGRKFFDVMNKDSRTPLTMNKKYSISSKDGYISKVSPVGMNSAEITRDFAADKQRKFEGKGTKIEDNITDKSYSFNGKSYTHKELNKLGYSDKDIEKAIKLGNIK